MTDPNNWSPDWAVRPGDVLVDALEERGMTQAELGRRMARPLKTISEIATGKAAVTPDTAVQLERTLGIPAAIWLRLEAAYRERQARERDRAELASHIEWLGRFPVKQLRERGLVHGATPAEQAESLLSYFGVTGPTGWEQHWGNLAGSYRMSESAQVSRYAVASWLREAEVEVASARLPRFRPTEIHRKVPRLRELTRAIVFAGAVEEARHLLGEAGVGLVLVGGYPGAPASGAVRWIKGSPWIILTLRYKTDDQFWFSLFHELGHLLTAGKGSDVVEEMGGPGSRAEEDSANAFAREALVPQDALDRLVGGGDFGRGIVRSLAAEIGVAPGVVVGRLQRDGLVRKSQLNDLKVRLDTDE